MSAGLAFGRALSCAAAILAGVMAAQGQVIITNADLFNQVGQYYRTYANSTNESTVDISGVLGTAGSVAQAWNFTTGSQDVTNRYDYLAAGNTPYGADFAVSGRPARDQWLYSEVPPGRPRAETAGQPPPPRHRRPVRPPARLNADGQLAGDQPLDTIAATRRPGSSFFDCFRPPALVRKWWSPTFLAQWPGATNFGDVVAGS
ncbi:MAG: hypothetical protein ACLQM8_15675 [Limisphaerales bacterium]